MVTEQINKIARHIFKKPKNTILSRTIGIYTLFHLATQNVASITVIANVPRLIHKGQS